MRFKNMLLGSVAALIALAPFAGARAQAPSYVPPFNMDTYYQTNPNAPLINNVAKIGGTTTNSATQTNPDKTGLWCVANQSAISGSPSWTFAIQGFDAATQSWTTLATSPTITTDTTPINYGIMIHPGLIAADVPSNVTGKSLHLPRVWRVQQVIAGSVTTATTSKVGCNLLK